MNGTKILLQAACFWLCLLPIPGGSGAAVLADTVTLTSGKVLAERE